jgi:MFS family permease
LPIAYLINRIADAEQRDRELQAATNRGAGYPVHRSLDPQFSLIEALRLKAFWFLSFAMALRHLVTEGVSVHFVILLVDRGWSTEAASGLLGVSALIGAPTRVGMGWLGDLVDKRKLVIGLLLALSISVCVMGWAAGSLVFTTFMIVYSLAYGGLASLQEPIRADYFGTKAFATIQGVSRSITTAGTFMGPIIAGLFYDLTKSYAVAFSIFAVVSLLSMVLMFLAKPPAKETA